MKHDELHLQQNRRRIKYVEDQNYIGGKYKFSNYGRT